MTIRIHRNDLTNLIEEIEFSEENLAERQQAGLYLQAEILRALQTLTQKVDTMAQTEQDQVAQLSSDVTALTSAFTGFETAVAAEIATIKAQPAAADPVVAQSLANIEALTAKIVADTAAAAPASTDTGSGSTDAPTT